VPWQIADSRYFNAALSASKQERWMMMMDTPNDIDVF
jgi:hypothetical protein